LNNKKNELVFSHIYYPSIFHIPLLTFLIYYRNNDYHISAREWGNYLVILENSMISKPINYPIIPDEPGAKEILFNLDCLNKEKESFWPLAKLKGVLSLFDITNNLSHISFDTATLIDLAVKRDYLGFLNVIYNNTFNDMFKQVINEDPLGKVSIVNFCLFVVNDLNKFLGDIKKKGYSISGGPQRCRSEINSLKSFLSSLDIDFRESLYNHNNYHVYKGTIRESEWLPRGKFSYRNIHMNISSIKW